MTLQILDESGELLRTFKGTPGKQADSAALVGGDGASELPVAEGFNTLMWNLRGEALETDIHEHLLEDEKGMAHVGRFGEGTPGIAVVPGRYQVRLSVGEWIQTQPLQIEILPNLSTTVEALQEQYDLAAEIAWKLKEVYDGLTTLQDIKAQTTGILNRIKKAGIEAGEISEAAKAMTAKLSEIEKKMTRGPVGFQDSGGSITPMLDSQLVLLYVYVDGGSVRALQRSEAQGGGADGEAPGGDLDRSRRLQREGARAERAAGGRCPGGLDHHGAKRWLVHVHQALVRSKTDEKGTNECCHSSTVKTLTIVTHPPLVHDY